LVLLILLSPDRSIELKPDGKAPRLVAAVTTAVVIPERTFRGRQIRPAGTIEGKGTGRSLPEINILALYYEIMPDSENLRRRANLLLALAQKARDDDYIKLAANIVDRATQLFDEAIILERGSARRASPTEAA
jgi:hypothetical protein